MTDEIFVFGSNFAGRHGKGAALYAKEHYGAENGVGEGPTGRAYAIPTKDEHLRPIPAWQVGVFIQRFCDHARVHPDKVFLVTPIGTGLAGLDKRAIWKAFVDAKIPSNCRLTSTWIYNPDK
jgi:hypothetical protein